MPFIDIHTHNRNAATDTAILSGAPYDTGRVFSAGIHPWDIAEGWEEKFDAVKALSRHSNAAAIGECGIDKMNSPASITLQKEIFLAHALLAEELHKPLIIHCVKAVDEIIALRREARPTQAWIIHGFRGKPQQAVQLINAGFYIALGEKFNPETAKAIPADRLFIESDESTLPIEEIYSRIATAKNVSTAQLAGQIRLNAHIFGQF